MDLIYLVVHKMNILLEKTQKLSIGIYSIYIKNLTNGELYYLPDSAKEFLCTKEYLSTKDTYISEYNINYTIQFEEIVEPDYAPKTRFDDGPFPYIIYQVPSGDFLWIRKNKYNMILLAYLISSDWSTWRLVTDNSESNGDHSFAELAYIFAYSILNKGGILFHGVVMEWQGMGVIVCAHSGVGKTTHTSMWRDNENAQIHNGDRALCCKEENRWYAYGAPWCGSSNEYTNHKVPLKAIVVLEQAVLNEVVVLSMLAGTLEIIQLAFAPTWEDKLMICSLNHIDDIIKNVVVLKLKCRADLDAVAVLKTELEKYR